MHRRLLSALALALTLPCVVIAAENRTTQASNEAFREELTNYVVDTEGILKGMVKEGSPITLEDSVLNFYDGICSKGVLRGQTLTAIAKRVQGFKAAPGRPTDRRNSLAAYFQEPEARDKACWVAMNRYFATATFDAIKRQTIDLVEAGKSNDARRVIENQLNGIAGFARQGSYVQSRPALANVVAAFERDYRSLLSALPQASAPSNSAEHRVLGDDIRRGGELREVWGLCADGAMFNANKWARDSYWTAGAKRKTLQREGLSLDSAIREVCAD